MTDVVDPRSAPVDVTAAAGRAQQPKPNVLASHLTWREAVAVVAVAAAVVCVMTYPFAFKLGSGGRVISADGQYSIWNVAWVARTLVVDPAHLFDANIFYPHRGTLAFSEANLVAGVLAVPVYWLTRNPYAAHNSVVLMTFLLSAIGTYMLVRHLARDVWAAAVSAALFAFCPYVFAHMPHVQLLMTGWLPIVLLALHRFVDRPRVTAAVWLALALVVQALAAGYYGAFAALVVALGVLYFAAVRNLWRNGRFWALAAASAGLALLLVVPFVGLYSNLSTNGEPFRSLSENIRWSADWRSYITAGGYGNRWMAQIWGRGTEVLFPGFINLALGLTAMGLGVRAWWVSRGQPSSRADEAASRTRGVVLFYAILTGFALWLSLGPRAGLYRLFYEVIPVFGLMRAPARLGVFVSLGLAVLSGLALTRLLAGRRRGAMIAVALAILATAKLAQVPLRFTEAPLPSFAYRSLAKLPRGAVAEFPFFSAWPTVYRHAYYMLNSTWHWQPLINGYSDYFPDDYNQVLDALGTFPSVDGFSLLCDRGARYVVFHPDLYEHATWQRVVRDLQHFKERLRPLVRSGDAWLYELAGCTDQ